METLKTIISAGKSSLTSKHMKAFYWLSATQFVAQFLQMFGELMTTYELPEWFVVALGLAISRLTKELNTRYGGKIS